MDKEDIKKIINDLIDKHCFDGISIYNLPIKEEIEEGWVTRESGNIININLRLIKEEKDLIDVTRLGDKTKTFVEIDKGEK